MGIPRSVFVGRVEGQVDVTLVEERGGFMVEGKLLAALVVVVGLAFPVIKCVGD